MKYIIPFVIFIALSYSAFAGCCVVSESKCTYWNLGSWSLQENWCNFFTGFGISTTYTDSECVGTSIPANCCDGWSGTCQTSITPPASVKHSSGGGSSKCVPNWNCTEWSDCIGGTQTRTCKFLTNCRTYTPDVVRDCNVANASGSTDLPTDQGNAQLEGENVEAPINSFNTSDAIVPVVVGSQKKFDFSVFAAISAMIIALIVMAALVLFMKRPNAFRH